jgi:hypothetical protein
MERGNLGGQGLMKRQFRSTNSRLFGAVAVTGLLLVPLGVFGGPALARTASAVGEYGHSGSSQYQYKVTVCHHTGSKHHPWHLITISNRAVAAHLRHHDVMPPCPTTLTVAKNHGKSGDDHGKSSSAGSQSQSTSGSQSHKDDDHGNGKDNGHHGKP